MIRTAFLALATGLGLIGLLAHQHVKRHGCDPGYVGTVWPDGAVTCVLEK